MNVLIVDDDAVLLSVFCEVLREEGMTVDGVRDIDAARSALKDKKYDVLVLDMRIGDRFGTELLSELCDRIDAPPTLALSASPSEGRWAERYCVPFVSKPFVMDVLIRAMGVAVAPKRTRPSGSSRTRAAFRQLPSGSE